MCKFLAVMRHQLSEVQITELKSKGFTEIQTESRFLSPVDDKISEFISELKERNISGITFVAPSLITAKLVVACKQAGIKVLLANSKPDFTKRKKTKIEVEPDHVIVKILSHSFEVKDDGVYILGQMPFLHLNFEEV